MSCPKRQYVAAEMFEVTVYGGYIAIVKHQAVLDDSARSIQLL